MLKAENMIKIFGLQYPWSPTLAIAILHLSIWKLIKSELKTKTSGTTKLQQITTRLHNLDKQHPSSIILYKHDTIKTINRHITTIIKTLKTTKKNSRSIRGASLQGRIVEAKLDDNQKMCYVFI